MSGFDADWLAQREPFDLAARSRPLEQAFADVVKQQSPVRLADLGGGTAANFRALAPRLVVDQQWLLLDHDPDLLAAAPERVVQWARAQGWQAEHTPAGCEVRTLQACWTLATQAIDLAASLESLDARRFDGIVTTAFLDLVSRDWLARFARWLVDAGRPLLATLTVDGLRRWHPAVPDDALIEQSFRQHQGGDKGFGDSVGPGAAAVLAECLRTLHCPVRIERSDWQIDASAPAMLVRMAEEAAQVALEVDPEARDRITAWQTLREAQIRWEQALLVIGHVDLLAIPARHEGT